MKTAKPPLHDTTSAAAIAAAAAAMSLQATPGNGQGAAPLVDSVTGEPILSASASPPPPQSSQVQKVARKLNLEEIRKTRAQVTASIGEAFRIPVIDSPSSAYFIRSHSAYGGLDDPLPIWKREGVGKGAGGLLLVKPYMVERIRAHGGKVAMCGVWWCQYSVGGQFLVAVNAESDNDWLVSARKIYDASRDGWLKRVNAGNCWNGLPPPATIPDPQWTDLAWDDVLNLGWDEEVDENYPAFLSLVYGGHVPVVKE